MFSKLGIISIGAGCLAWLFGTLSEYMGSHNVFVDMTLSTFSEGVAEYVVNVFSSEWIQDPLYTIFYEIHLGGIFLGLGVILIVISLFAKEY